VVEIEIRSSGNFIHENLSPVPVTDYYVTDAQKRLVGQLSASVWQVTGCDMLYGFMKGFRLHNGVRAYFSPNLIYM
jgi:hypothetical protein